MGWFDDQIRQRKEQDEAILNESFQEIGSAILGHRLENTTLQEGEDIRDAIDQLLKHFRVKKKEVPLSAKTLDDQLEYLLGSSGIMYRKAVLEKGWHKDAMGAMLATLKEDGSVITLRPSNRGGYIYLDPKTQQKVRVGRSNEESIDTFAYVFYKPFPMRSISMKDFQLYMLESLTKWDMVSFAICAAIITLIGTLIPKLNSLLSGVVIQTGNRTLLLAVVQFMIFATVSSMVFTGIRELLLERIKVKINVNVQAATMMRILSMPTDFFRKYTAGEMTQYMGYMNSLGDTLVDAVFSTGVTGLFSLVYMFQIFHYAKSLVLPSLIITITTLAVSMIVALMQTSISKEAMTIQAKENGLIYSLITGIEKIRLSGAESRAFAKWAKVYAKEAALTYNPPAFLKLNGVITGMITLVGTMIMYYIAVVNHVTLSEYIAFNAAYGYIEAAFAAMAQVAMVAATIRPTLSLIKPLMEAEPEVMEDKEEVDRISGSIELSHVSFKYQQDSPLILDDVSLRIPARQYVAIVGKTGCGKSTLMRLLLGFEQPNKGAIYYDKKDMSKLNLKTLRKKIGIVMQDGKLFSGSIFENISVSNPTMTLDDAWEAADTAGLAEDIHMMPMGMATMIAEGTGGFSGGQKQRLMIARAVAGKPKILILDEATSALDNIIQKKVADALDEMKCTRIVIAHRLSTIRHCDRILVLDGGKIIEDGNYESLIAQNGFFAELVKRQRLDLEELE